MAKKNNNKKIIKPTKYVKATGIVCNSGTTITPYFIGKRVSVHNGNIYQSFTALRGSAGYKFGEFIMTKSLGPKIHSAVKDRKFKKLLKKK